MFAKVAYLCTIMVAVQSRAVLYGTTIIGAVSSRPSTQNNQVIRSDDPMYGQEEVINEMIYSIYDLGNKMLQYISQNIKLGDFLGDTPISTLDVIKTVKPPAASNAVLQQDIKPFSENTLLDNIDVQPVVKTDNKSVFSNELLRMIWRTSGLAAFGYEN